MILLFFVLGLLPIIAGLVFLAYLIGRVAKKYGKDPWLFGILFFVLMVLLLSRFIPTFAAKIFYAEMQGLAFININLTGETVTLKDANNVYFRSSIDGVEFDVPLNYHFREYNPKLGGWHLAHSRKQHELQERQEIDYINISALLPELEPVTEANLTEFQVLGWGNRMSVSLTHFRPHEYFFKNTLPSLERREPSPEMPGMFHYYYYGSDLYMSHDQPVKELTTIRCNDQAVFHEASPACNINTFYIPKYASQASLDSANKAILSLEYYIPRQYLPQWESVDQKLKQLLDQFNLHTSNH